MTISVSQETRGAASKELYLKPKKTRKEQQKKPKSIEGNK